VPAVSAPVETVRLFLSLCFPLTLRFLHLNSSKLIALFLSRLPVQCRTVGASLGITSACPSSTSSSCSITCRNPQQPNSCLILQSYFVKGTSCGLAGRCDENGECINGGLNSLDAAKNWYMFVIALCRLYALFQVSERALMPFRFLAV
jgi:hypothetical protein